MKIKINTEITYENLARAMCVLIGEDMDEEQAQVVLQAIGYTLLDAELFPDDDSFDDEEYEYEEVEYIELNYRLYRKHSFYSANKKYFSSFKEKVYARWTTI